MWTVGLNSYQSQFLLIPLYGYGVLTRDAEAEVEAVFSLRKRKGENSTASTYEGKMEGEKKLVLLSFGEERIGGA